MKSYIPEWSQLIGEKGWKNKLPFKGLRSWLLLFDQNYNKNFEILLQFKLTVFYANIL